MIRYFGFIFTVISLTILVGRASAFETPTHWQISNASYDESKLSTSNVIFQLGLKDIASRRIFRPLHAETDPDLFTVGVTCDPKSLMRLRQLLVCGAMFEDIPGVRSFNHFFDPISGDPLMVGNKPPGANLGVPNMTSPDWSIQDNNYIDAQQYSYRRAREHFLKALSTEGASSISNGRNVHWAHTFQALGHVIHHVQDMAQPQHTRNDAHADWLTSLFGLWQFHQLRHPSRFEKYSRSPPGSLKIDQAIANSFPPAYPTYSQYFKRPRDFWSGNGHGLADYSNSNFVSQGTNFSASGQGALSANSKYPSPVPSGFETVTLSNAFGTEAIPQGIAKLCQDVGLEYCEMTFYSNAWKDPLTNTAVTNRRASTVSIFDEDLNGRPFTYSLDDMQVTTTRAYALNQLNFDAAYAFLVPRAVAYSAGLINYFFRGQMEITLPADGIYALVDHHAQRCKDNCGFGKVKLKVKNITSGEGMSAGNLRAVAKFHRNNCYRDDLSGDPGGPAFAGISCRSPEEEIVVSAPMALSVLEEQEEREIAFTFPKVIPINATDLYLQVVFQGKLGEEVDAVAVATKDISEANYFAFTRRNSRCSRSAWAGPARSAGARCDGPAPSQ